MIIYGVDANGIARPVLVDEFGKLLSGGSVTVDGYLAPLMNERGATVIAGETIDGDEPIMRVDANGKIILSGANDMAGFLLVGQHGTVLSPADSLVYYFGSAQGAPVVTTQRARLRILQNCRLSKVAIEVNVAGVLGTAENSTFAVRINDTTDLAVFTTVTMNAIQQAFVSAALSQVLSAGDFIEGKLTCPVWVTNPTNISIVSYYWFDLT